LGLPRNIVQVERGVRSFPVNHAMPRHRKGRGINRGSGRRLQRLGNPAVDGDPPHVHIWVARRGNVLSHPDICSFFLSPSRWLWNLRPATMAFLPRTPGYPQNPSFLPSFERIITYLERSSQKWVRQKASLRRVWETKGAGDGSTTLTALPSRSLQSQPVSRHHGHDNGRPRRMTVAGDGNGEVSHVPDQGRRRKRWCGSDPYHTRASRRPIRVAECFTQ
jgi:hypothetical protein